MLDSPMRLAAVIIAGALLGSSAFLLMAQIGHPVALGLGIFLPLVALSMGSVIWAGSTLRDGVQNERWPENEVQPLRAVVTSRAWKAAKLGLFSCLIAALVFEHSAHDYPYF